MTAYFIADIEIIDPEMFEGYRRAVPAVDAMHGGRYIGRGGKTITLEGNWQPSRLVIVEFADMNGSLSWYTSPEHAPLLELRKKCASSRALACEGV